MDLSQFDNITNAIGKLNVQPLPPAKPERDLPRPTPRSTQSGVTKSTPTQAVSSFASSTSSGAKRISNPRQNHGRAVAPPKLPGSAGVCSTNRLNSELINNTKEPQAANETFSMQAQMPLESANDYSQSPIAQRLLKFSKDYKGN